jgi:ribosomal-protein-alanine N-acetyltransferase
MAQRTGSMKAASRLETERLTLRKPEAADAAGIFERYASDDRVGRYLAWPIHRSLDDTHLFLNFAEAEWAQWPAGPFLVFHGDELVGSTGLAFETSTRASTGYVFAVDAWGRGYATECVRAMKGLAASLGVRRLYAGVHPEHRPSARVLEKAGFRDDGIARGCCEFPNQAPGVLQDVRLYAVDLGDSTNQVRSDSLRG